MWRVPITSTVIVLPIPESCRHQECIKSSSPMRASTEIALDMNVETF